jgi:hypothetical protein
MSVYIHPPAVQGLSGRQIKRLRKAIKERVDEEFPELADGRVQKNMRRWEIRPWFLFALNTATPKRKGKIIYFCVVYDPREAHWLVTLAIDPDKTPLDDAGGGSLTDPDGGAAGRADGLEDDDEEPAARRALRFVRASLDSAKSVAEWRKVRAQSRRIFAVFWQILGLMDNLHKSAEMRHSWSAAWDLNARIANFLENPALRFVSRSHRPVSPKARRRTFTQHLINVDESLTAVLSDDGLFVPELFGIRFAPSVNRLTPIPIRASALLPAWSASKIALHNERLQV